MAKQAVEQYERLGMGGCSEATGARIYGAYALGLMGEPKLMEEWVEGRAQASAAVGDHYATKAYSHMFAWSRAVQGDIGGARNMLAFADGVDSPSVQAALRVAIEVMCLVALGEPALAFQKCVERSRITATRKALAFAFSRYRWYAVRGAAALAAAQAAVHAGNQTLSKGLQREAKDAVIKLCGVPYPGARAAASVLRAALGELQLDFETALYHSEVAAEEYAKHGMRLYEAAARLRMGQLLGGDHGRQISVLAAAELSARGVSVLAAGTGSIISDPRLL